MDDADDQPDQTSYKGRQQEKDVEDHVLGEVRHEWRMTVSEEMGVTNERVGAATFE